MTDTINTGGQAFPCEGGTDSGLHPDAGMTLRDYFAAKAMQGALANSEAIHAGAEPTNSCLFGARSRETARDYAMSAYRIADAMLAARGGAL